MIALKGKPNSFTPAQYEVVNMMSCLKRESDVVALTAESFLAELEQLN